MALIPRFVVDALPARWWAPGNLRITPVGDFHFCVGAGGVRTVEWNGRQIGAGHRSVIADDA